MPNRGVSRGAQRRLGHAAKAAARANQDKVQTNIETKAKKKRRGTYVPNSLVERFDTIENDIIKERMNQKITKKYENAWLSHKDNSKFVIKK